MQGDANRSADFYLKETPDGAVCFESFTCPGMYISVSNSAQVQGRHFSISLLVCSYIVHLESTTYDFLFQLLMYDHEVYQIFYIACHTHYTCSETEIYLLTL